MHAAASARPRAPEFVDPPGYARHRPETTLLYQQAGGFSLHAGLDIQTGQRAMLERLCRYVSRPSLAVERLALTASGQVRRTSTATQPKLAPQAARAPPPPPRQSALL
jgi:hypothetical protein